MNTLDYLANLLGHVTKFDGFEYIKLTSGPDGVGAQSIDKGMACYVSTDPNPVSGLDVDACLGNLKYLAKVVTIDQFSTKGSSVSLVTGADSTGADAVQSIAFKSPRLSVNYEATDVSMVKMVIPATDKLVWGDDIELTPEHYKEFSDLNTLQKLADPTNSTFELSKKDGNLVATLGTGAKSAEFVLGAGNIKNAIKFSNPLFMTLLGIVSSDGGGLLSVCDLAIRVKVESKGIHYTFIAPASR